MARQKSSNLFVCQIKKDIIRFKTNVDLSCVTFNDEEKKFALKKKKKTYEEL